MQLRRSDRLHKVAVDSEIWYEFQPGDRVLTREGIFGRVVAVEDGPHAGNEQYVVELDAGMGGGAYSASELRHPTSDHVEPGFEAAASKVAQGTERYIASNGDEGHCSVCGIPISYDDYEGDFVTPCCGAEVCEWSNVSGYQCYVYDSLYTGQVHGETITVSSKTAATVAEPGPEVVEEGETCLHCGQPIYLGRDGEWYHSGTQSRECDPDFVVGSLEGHLASDDYPELADILVERPPLPHAEKVGVKEAVTRFVVTNDGETVSDEFTTYGEAFEIFRELNGGDPFSKGNGLQVERVDVPRKEAGFFTDRVLAPAADRMIENQNPNTRYNPQTGEMASVDWCRFRRDRRCYYPKALDEKATEQAGYAVWIPQDRGLCPRDQWDAQRQCPLSEPGPNSGSAKNLTDATVPWDQGGQRYDNFNRPVPVNIYASTGEVAGSRTTTQDPEFQFHFTAAWRDVQEKASRIRRDGHVRVISSTPAYLVGEVRGDTNVYQTTLHRDIGSNKVALWECGCAWAAYSWGRSGRWKKFEGRMCSHALALHYEGQSRGWGGQQIAEDAAQPTWMSDPSITVKVPGDYKKPDMGEWRLDASRKTADLQVGDVVEFDGLVGTYAGSSWLGREAPEGRVWFMSAQGDLMLARPEELVPSDKGGIRRVELLDTFREVSVDPSLRPAPVMSMIQDMMGDRDDAEEIVATVASLGVPNASELVKMAAAPFEVKWRGVIHQVVEMLSGGKLKLDTGEEVPASEVVNPKYDPLLGLASKQGSSQSMDYFMGYEKGQEDADLGRPNEFAGSVRGGDKGFVTGYLDGYENRPPDPPFEEPVYDWYGDEDEDEGWQTLSRQAVSQELRDTFEWQHAYDWAYWGLMPHEDAEDYADWFVEEYQEDTSMGDKSHVDMAEWWRADRAREGVKVANADSGEGCMIAFRPPEHILQAFESDEPFEELHVTVAYLGKAAEINKEMLLDAVGAWSQRWPSFPASFSGYGVFENTDNRVLVALVDMPGFEDARSDLLDIMAGYGLHPMRNHGYTPHMTLAYGDGDVTAPDSLPEEAKGDFQFDSVFVVHGGEWTEVAFTGRTAKKAELNDEPEPALPETTGEDEVDASDFMGDETDLADEPHEVPAAIVQEDKDLRGKSKTIEGVSRPEWLNAEGGGHDSSNGEIASLARETLAKMGLKAFTPEEQRMLIEEGEGVTASNLDLLDLSGTHYEALEEALQLEEELDEMGLT